MFDLFFEYLISFFERECFFVGILKTKPCTDNPQPMWIMSLASASIFTVFQVSSLDQNVVNLLLISFW